jgi:hypothetical protein
LPEGRTLDSTTIYTTALRFSHDGDSATDPDDVQTGGAGDEDDSRPDEDFDNVTTPPGEESQPEANEPEQPENPAEPVAVWTPTETLSEYDGTNDSAPTAAPSVSLEGLSPADWGRDGGDSSQRRSIAWSGRERMVEKREDIDSIIEGIKESLAESEGASDIPGFDSLGTSIQVKTMSYTGPIVYSVPKTGYYCVGESPFTIWRGWCGCVV